MSPAKLRNRLLQISRPMERPAPGEYTTEQWAKKWGYEASSARRLIINGLRAGLMYRKYYRVALQERIMRTPHYGEVKSPKPAKKTK